MKYLFIAFICLIVLSKGVFGSQESSLAGTLIAQYINNSIATIDVATGKATLISDANLNFVGAQQLSCLDDTNGILYQLVVDQSDYNTKVIGYDLNNAGNIVTNVILPDVALEIFAGIGQAMTYDATTNSVYVVAHGNATSEDRNFIQVDIESSSATLINTIISSDTIDIFGQFGGSDDNGKMWTEWYDMDNNNTQMVSIDMKTGKSVDVVDDIVELQTITYDQKTNTFIGLNINSNFTRDVYEFNPSTLKYTPLGTVDSELNIIDGTIQAFDQYNRVLYVYLTR